MQDEARIPVIVGVGQVNDRPADPFEGLDSAGLMEAALREADRDGGGGWLGAVESLGVVAQISFPLLGDVSAVLAGRLGIAPRFRAQTKEPNGDGPVLLLHEAANRVARGEVVVAAIAGGEALRTAAGRAAADAGTAVSAQNAIRGVARAHAASYPQRYGLVAPVDVYPLYENACRAAWGQTLAEAQAESAMIWQLFSEVAEANPAAWLRKRRSADEIATPSAENRPIAFPYTKLMVANSAVNQGAAIIVTSLAQAKARGIAEERLVYIGAGAAAHESEDVLARDRYDHSAGMQASLVRTLAMNDLSVEDLDRVELYSCFPCVPKMARRVIGWPAEKPATVFGGLTFGGGPIGNTMSHAIASMTLALRKDGRHGLLFANGGYATHNHSIVLSRTAPRAGIFPQDFDVQPDADAARAVVPRLDETFAGPATIETYTVFHGRDGAATSGVVVARTPHGTRTLAHVPGGDLGTLAFLTGTEGEPVGQAGTIASIEGMQVWQRELQN